MNKRELILCAGAFLIGAIVGAVYVSVMVVNGWGKWGV